MEKKEIELIQIISAEKRKWKRKWRRDFLKQRQNAKVSQQNTICKRKELD